MIDIVVGLQYGDEGKGKIVDFLSPHYQVVVRYQGGSNAGHTVYVDEQKYVLHMIPVGILHKKKSVIAHGCVVNPEELLKEIYYVMDIFNFTELEQLKHLLYIDKNCHVTTQSHLEEDKENQKKYGSTGKGIGPTYRDKVYRKGIRLGDVIEDYPDLVPFITDTRKWLFEQMRHPPVFDFLLEGAQAMMLDVDMGLYPYVTSSPCTANYAPQGTGLPLKFFEKSNILGVVKAYTTRIAVGPFESEMDTETSDRLREIGHEYGATTGRPRRIGWLNMEELQFAVDVNGVTQLALTRLDTLSELGDRIVVFGKNGIKIEFPNWKIDVNVKSYMNLDENLLRFINFIEKELDVPVKYLGIGPDRKDIIIK